MTDSAFATHAVDATRPRTAQRSRFFVVASVTMLLLVLIGFGPTFYLRSFLPARPIPAYLYAHGGVMTAWYSLFVVQTVLIATRRHDLHRRLGIVGALLAAAVAATGFHANRQLVPRMEALRIDISPELRSFLDSVAPTGLLVIGAFCLFVGAALILRRNADAHRRLMFMAFLTGLGTAVGPGRWLGNAAAHLLPPWLGLSTLVSCAFLVALAAHDWASLRRVHPITLCGGGLLLIIPALADTGVVRMLATQLK